MQFINMKFISFKFEIVLSLYCTNCRDYVTYAFGGVQVDIR